MPINRFRFSPPLYIPKAWASFVNLDAGVSSVVLLGGQLQTSTLEQSNDSAPSPHIRRLSMECLKKR